MLNLNIGKLVNTHFLSKKTMLMVIKQTLPIFKDILG